jgi:hypothetical protein
MPALAADDAVVRTAVGYFGIVTRKFVSTSMLLRMK